MQGLRGLARRMGQGVVSRGRDKGGRGWRGARPFRRRRPHSELKGRSAAPGAGEGGCEGGGSGFSLAASFSHTVQSIPTCSPTEQKRQAETKGISKGHGRCLNPAPKRLPGDGRSTFCCCWLSRAGARRGLRKTRAPPAPAPHHAVPLPGMLQTQRVAQGLEPPSLHQAGSVPAAPAGPQPAPRHEDVGGEAVVGST